MQGECVLGLMRAFRGSDVLRFAEDLSELTYTVDLISR